jgi:hypothetical protein
MASRKRENGKAAALSEHSESTKFLASERGEQLEKLHASQWEKAVRLLRRRRENERAAILRELLVARSLLIAGPLCYEKSYASAMCVCVVRN